MYDDHLRSPKPVNPALNKKLTHKEQQAQPNYPKAFAPYLSKPLTKTQEQEIAHPYYNYVPTQRDINRINNELSTLEAQEANQTYDEKAFFEKADTTDYATQISEKQDQLNRYVALNKLGQKNLFESGVIRAKPSYDGAATDRDAIVSNAIQYIINPNFRAEIEKVYQKEAEGGVVTLDTTYKSLDYLTDKEKSTLLGYANRGDWDNAKKYYDIIKSILNERYQQEQSALVQKISNESKAIGVMANLSSALYTPAAYLATLGQKFKNDYSGNYEQADINSMGFAGTHLQQDSQYGITKDMSPAGQVATGVALSVGRMFVSSMLGAPVAKALTAFDSAGQSTFQALQSGATPDQATAVGTAAAIIEYVTEKIPLDTLLKSLDEGAASLKQVYNNAKSGFKSELIQEAVSEYANNLTDEAIMGSKSQYHQMAQQLMSQGYSKEEAGRKAFLQFYIVNPVIAGVAGGFTGGTLNAGMSALNYTSPAVIDKSSLEAAQEHLQNAEVMKDFAETTESFKSVLLPKYGKSGSTQVKIESAVDGKTYEITIDKNTAENILSAPKVSAEKLTVLKNIDAVVQNSTYVESGKVTTKSGGKKVTAQHDYFEALVTISGGKYIAHFDVTVNKGTGKNVITGIDVVKAPEAGSPNTMMDSAPDPRTEDISSRYIEQMQQMYSSGTTDNSTSTLVNNKGAGYNGSQEPFATEGTGDYEPDIIIGRSVGAKAKNYDIVAPDGEILNLAEGTHISNVEVIAGQGRNRQIDIVDYLVDNYGGDSTKWKKCKGLGYVDVNGESLLAELHWYEEPNVGRVAFKIKPQPGGEYYIYEN